MPARLPYRTRDRWFFRPTGGGRRPWHAGRFAGLAMLLVLSATGCSLVRYPSQAHPTCSWSSTPPGNADALCHTVFTTLSAIARAEARGDDGAVRRLVADPHVARRVMQFGAEMRRQRARDLHVVPSITLDQTQSGLVGAGFYLLARGTRGKISDPETVYLQLRHGTAIVVHDQPGQQW